MEYQAAVITVSDGCSAGTRTDTSGPAVRAMLEEKLSQWSAGSEGMMLRYDRDRYLFVFEEKSFSDFAAKRFDVLDAVREVVAGEGVAATLSIGVGRDADSFEIKVQPPGKQLKTITLLSGGEKAFVAIALYFAIMKVHPTPFCVMDEIEAALDEANVVRYARYMRRIAGKTQFIVITHRRGTMEEADVLYGVTMQERGVSRILTINLNDMAKELKIK